MGKTAEEEKKSIKANFKEELSELNLPIPVPEEKELHELFHGNHIAVVEGQIIAFDPSLRSLHDKIDQRVSKKKTCHVQWIDEGFAIHGIAV